MIQPKIEERFTEGIRLFNQGNFFEAHELWEHEWKTAKGIERISYQGIIQAAAALLHVQRGNCAGALALYLKSWPKLTQLPEVWMGIELGQFRLELRRYFAALQASSDARGGDCQSRVVQLAGREELPTIRWASR